ncbi:MAG: NADH-quinone oxidoreductase subunit L [Anaerolineales bacterium]|nr:NADH-quinone oxidoreductase subunit L [Anaerolineales bacterium]
MLATTAFLIPLPPLAAFAVILLFTRRNRALSTAAAVGSLLLSAAGAFPLIIGALQGGNLAQNPVSQSVVWIPGPAAVRVGVLVDGLTVLMLAFVMVTLLAIFVYSIGYHHFGRNPGPADAPGFPPRGMEVRDGGRIRRVPTVEPLYGRFFALLSLFAFGMLLLVLADNLASFFVGWEVMGLCSYLLIGFWYGRERARRAAVKAFLVTRIGDVLMLIGMAVCWNFSGTLSLREILSPDNLTSMAAAPSAVPGLSAAGLAGLLFLAGTIGKSAQWPLHVWLPDAMEGPTPVSALIHAATMVSAGVYLLLRTAPLLWVAGSPASGAAALLGASSALFAAACALTQTDLKRLLAYSTVSQLGYMVAAAGIGASAAAAFHLAVHACFKALLFLGAGSVAHGIEHGAMQAGAGAEDPQDMRAMGGLAARMPLTFAAFLAGGFSLAGLPLVTSGFWSKDGILTRAFHSSPGVFLVLAAAALITAVYVARLLALVFLGRPRSRAAAQAAEPSRWMLAPIAFLVVPAVAAGWAGIPEDFPVLGGILPDWIGRLTAQTATPLSPQRWIQSGPAAEADAFAPVVLAVSLLAGTGGLLLGWLLHRRYGAGRKDPLEALFGGAYGFLQAGCRFDNLYRKVFAEPARWAARVLVSEWIDGRILGGILRAAWKAAGSAGRVLRGAVDLALINGAADGIGRASRRAAGGLRALQSGRVQEYLLIAFFVFSALAAALAWGMLKVP